MKTLNDLSSSILKDGTSTGCMVDYIAVIGGWRKLPQPTMSTDLKCTACDSTEHYTPIATNDVYNDPSKKVWICAGRNCVTTSKENAVSATKVLTNMRRALEWPLFCEINGIGDYNHSVRYELIKQSGDKEQKIKSFVNGDKPFLLLYGTKGTGKTYTSLGLCEHFTRTNASCIFTTQAQMMREWVQTFKEYSNYISRLTNTQLLVIDDFGAGNVPDGFMGFFMDLMNTRMQWRNRKTIISTNLKLDELSVSLGDPLVDRLCSGEIVEFIGHSRRF